MQIYSTYDKNLPAKERSSVLTRKGQITVPVDIRLALGLKQGDVVSFRMDENQVRLIRRGSIAKQTAGMLRGSIPPLSSQAEKKAAEEGMAEEAAS